jgi:hypothetical protein
VFALRGKNIPLPCVAASAAAIALLLASGCSRAPDFELEKVIEQRIEVPPGASASFSTSLDPGTYSIVVSELGIDVTTRVAAAGTVAELSDLAPRHGVQIAVIMVGDANRANVDVVARSIDHRTKTGAVSVEVRRWPNAMDARTQAAKRGELAYMQALSAIGDAADWDKVANTLGEGPRGARALCAGAG